MQRNESGIIRLSVVESRACVRDLLLVPTPAIGATKRSTIPEGRNSREFQRVISPS